jgi:hypothetical protein
MTVVINGTSGITGNSGTVISASTIGVGGATPSASGAGITFPATASLSTDANTLDDYEEGAFTPTLAYETPGTSSIVSSERFGTYTRIGRVVYFTIDYRISSFSKGTASGQIILGGLPFAQRNTGGYDSARITIDIYNWTYSSSPFVGNVLPSSTGIALSRMVSGSPNQILNDPSASSIIWATGFYFV